MADSTKKILSILEVIQQDVSGLKQDMEEVKATQQVHSASLAEIEFVLKGYGDMYKINSDNVGKIERRTEVLEVKLGVEPAAENILLKVS